MNNEQKPVNIKNFLSRFKKLGTSNKKIKESFIDVLQTQFDIHVDNTQVRVLKNNIYVRTTPIRKTEILQKKEYIISVLKERLQLDYLDIS